MVRVAFEAGALRPSRSVVALMQACTVAIWTLIAAAAVNNFLNVCIAASGTKNVQCAHTSFIFAGAGDANAVVKVNFRLYCMCGAPLRHFFIYKRGPISKHAF